MGKRLFLKSFFIAFGQILALQDRSNIESLITEVFGAEIKVKI